MKRILLLLLLISSLPVCAQLSYPAGTYMVDETNKMIICNRQPGAINPGLGTIELDKVYTFRDSVQPLSVGTEYSVEAGGNSYKLYFSRLPLINLTVSDTINSLDEIAGTIEISDTINQHTISNMGIKIRGALSSTFPKKGYRVQIKNSTGSNKDTTFFGLREDKRWLLLAMWNEKLRLNNIISHNLWSDMHTLYYASQEPSALPAIRLLYVEVFINAEYQGIYLFTEDMDRKQLKLKKDSGGVTHGELYKGDSYGGACTFESLPARPSSPKETWGGWEFKYPDNIDWNNLYDFTNFVINAPDGNFFAEITRKMDLDNAIDYFIFMNLLHAKDNTGKNVFLARYDKNEPYFYIPWDLDGTWGYDYVGERLNIYNNILSNGLYDRLFTLNPGDFKKRLSRRWFELRTGVLTTSALKDNILRQHDLLMNNGVYQREEIRWQNPLLSYDQSELDYIFSWVDNRISSLDQYFTMLDMSVDNNMAANQIFISPNPANKLLYVTLLPGMYKCRITITDITGKLMLYALELPPGINTIDISGFAEGLYILSIFDGGKQILTTKIIKTN